MKKLTTPMLGIFWAAMAATAGVPMKTEQINPADPAWKFKTNPRPWKSDVAQNAKVLLAGNSWPRGGSAGALVNGRLPTDPRELGSEAWLNNANSSNGNIFVDLGRTLPVAAVATYSWHENPPDQGARGPQQFSGGKVENLYEAVTKGDATKPTVKQAVDNALVCILGREAAARRTTLTMEQVIKESRKLEVDLKGLKS